MNAELKIYVEPGKLIAGIPLDSESGRQISIGSSDLCDIPLAKLAKDAGAAELKSVEPTHLVIFCGEDGFSLASPQKDNPPRGPDGKPVLDGSLATGSRISFGNCYLDIEVEGTGSSGYSLIVMKGGSQIATLDIPQGTHAAGDSASKSEIVLPFDTKGRRIFSVNATPDGILLAPECGEILKPDGSPLEAKAVVEISEQYRFGECTFRFLSPKAMAHPGMLSAARVLDMVVVALFAVSILLLADLFLVEHGTASRPEAKAVKTPDTSAKIAEMLKSGDVFGAAALLESLGDSADKGDSARAEALSDALATLAFHRRIVSLHEGNLVRKQFITALLGSKDPSLTLNCYVSYLDKAREEMEAAQKEMDSAGLGKEHSTFSRESAALNMKIDSLSSYYKHFTELNQAWTGQDWDKAVKILGSLSEKIKQAEMKSLVALCESRLESAKVGQRIQSLQSALSGKILSADELRSMGAELDSIEDSLGKIPDLDQNTSDVFNSETEDISATIALAEKIGNSFLAWKKDIRDEKAMLSLVETIAATPAKRLSEMQKNIRSISSEVSATVRDRIASVDETPSLMNLEECGNLAKICDMVSFFDPDLDGSVLEGKMARIKQLLLKRCDSLYAAYMEKRGKSDPSAKDILTEIVSNAPAGSRYREWAERELKKSQ